jgi:hypothetical protein
MDMLHENNGEHAYDGTSIIAELLKDGLSFH